MTFAILGFKSLDYLGSAATSPNTRNFWHTYVSNDDDATIETANYFDSIIGRLRHGDVMTVLGDVDGTAFKRDYTIDLTASAGHVTLSRQSGRAGKGLNTLAFYLQLTEIPANADLITAYVPGYAFKIEAIDFRVLKPVTTGSKLATITPKIGSTSVTGGALALTSALCTPAGAAVAGSAITALNTGAATDSLGLTSSAVTAFAEGSGWIILKIRNLDE